MGGSNENGHLSVPEPVCDWLFVLGCTETQSPTSIQQTGIGEITSTAKAAAPSATGTVGWYNPSISAYQFAIFDAHEAYAKRGAKGNLTSAFKHDPADLAPYAEIKFTVKYVKVDPATDTAWFAGVCISDTYGGARTSDSGCSSGCMTGAPPAWTAISYGGNGIPPRARGSQSYRDGHPVHPVYRRDRQPLRASLIPEPADNRGPAD